MAVPRVHRKWCTVTVLTFSKLALFSKCSAWTTMDAPRSTSREATLGTVFHRMVELNADGIETATLTVDEMNTLGDWWTAWKESPLSRETWVHEQAMAYDPRTGTGMLLAEKGRDYSKAPAGWIPGTDDMHTVVHGKLTDPGYGIYSRLVVCDLKTGRQEHTEPAATNKQLRALALTLCRALNCSEATVIIAFVSEDGVREDRAQLDALDLLGIEGELRELIAAGPTPPRPGHHCRDLYCPAIAVCPKTVDTLDAIVPSETPWTLELCDDATASAVLARCKAATKAIEIAEAAVKKYADEHGGIKLPSGKTWGPNTCPKESFSLSGPEGMEGIDIISRANAAGAIKSSITKADLKRCIPDKAARDEVIKKLRSAGCARSMNVTSYIERASKGASPDGDGE